MATVSFECNLELSGPILPSCVSALWKMANKKPVTLPRVRTGFWTESISLLSKRTKSAIQE